jgi:hypothetical protein
MANETESVRRLAAPPEHAHDWLDEAVTVARNWRYEIGVAAATSSGNEQGCVDSKL